MFKKDNYIFFFFFSFFFFFFFLFYFFFFCRHYSISDIPWYQRKAASVLFATPPESSFDESLKLFLHAEKIDPNFYRWVLTFVFSCFFSIYASPSSGEAYRDRRLTTNFELWVEIFCVSTCFHMRIPKPCLSVCPYPEKEITIASSILVLY